MQPRAGEHCRTASRQIWALAAQPRGPGSGAGPRTEPASREAWYARHAAWCARWRARSPMRASGPLPAHKLLFVPSRQPRFPETPVHANALTTRLQPSAVLPSQLATSRAAGRKADASIAICCAAMGPPAASTPRPRAEERHRDGLGSRRDGERKLFLPKRWRSAEEEPALARVARERRDGEARPSRSPMEQIGPPHQHLQTRRASTASSARTEPAAAPAASAADAPVVIAGDRRRADGNGDRGAAGARRLGGGRRAGGRADVGRPPTSRAAAPKTSSRRCCARRWRRSC